MRKVGFVAAAFAANLLVTNVGAALAAGDAERGAKLYQSRCGACHSLDADRVGPRHRGVVGRTAGTLPGYSYSAAVAASGVTWTEETLDLWLQDPAALIPGQRMNIRVRKEQDRADIIAYLRSQSP